MCDDGALNDRLTAIENTQAEILGIMRSLADQAAPILEEALPMVDKMSKHPLLKGFLR